MDVPNSCEHKGSYEIIRSIVELCSGCNTCRYLTEETCLFFPKFYRLWDRETENGVPITEAELRSRLWYAWSRSCLCGNSSSRAFLPDLVHQVQPLSRGLFIIRSITDPVVYKKAKGTNVLKMRKLLA